MWGPIHAMTQVQIASTAIGAVIGLISVTMLAVILRRIERTQPLEAIKALRNLIAVALGAGLADYAVFDFILKAGALSFYLDGFAVIFLPLGIITVILWLLSWLIFGN